MLQACRRAGVARRDDVGHWDLAEDGIGAADDDRVQDRRVGDQRLLDLARVEQLTAPVDHVVAAPGQEQEPGVIEVAEVAGVQPAGAVKPVAGPPVGVAVDDPRAADPDLAGGPGRPRAPGGIPDFGFGPGGTPARPGGRGAVERRGGDLAGGLGHAVAFDHRDAGPGLDPVPDRDGQRRRRGPDEPEARRPDGNGLRGQDGQDRGHGVDPGHVAGGGVLPESVPPEPAADQQRRAGLQAGQQRDDLGVDVEQRQRAEAPVGRGEPVVPGHGAGHVQQPVLGQLHRLGSAGGTGRQEQHRSRPGVLRRVTGRAGPVIIPNGPERGHTGTRDAVRAVADHHGGPGRVHGSHQFGHRGLRVHRDRAPARGDDAQVGGAELNRVRHVDQDPRARRDGGLVQRGGPLAGQHRQRGVGQHAAVLDVFEERSPPVVVGPPGQQPGEAAVR